MHDLAYIVAAAFGCYLLLPTVQQLTAGAGAIEASTLAWVKAHEPALHWPVFHPATPGVLPASAPPPGMAENIALLIAAIAAKKRPAGMSALNSLAALLPPAAVPANVPGAQQ